MCAHLLHNIFFLVRLSFTCVSCLLDFLLFCPRTRLPSLFIQTLHVFFVVIFIIEFLSVNAIVSSHQYVDYLTFKQESHSSSYSLSLDIILSSITTVSTELGCKDGNELEEDKSNSSKQNIAKKDIKCTKFIQKRAR